MDSTLGPSPEKQERSHERVSVTAWRVAYRRTLSDIPFSVEVFDELQKIMRRTRSAAELQELDQLVQPDITPIFEARFKLVNRLLKEENARKFWRSPPDFLRAAWPWRGTLPSSTPRWICRTS